MCAKLCFMNQFGHKQLRERGSSPVFNINTYRNDEVPESESSHKLF